VKNAFLEFSPTFNKTSKSCMKSCVLPGTWTEHQRMQDRRLFLVLEHSIASCVLPGTWTEQRIQDRRLLLVLVVLFVLLVPEHSIAFEFLLLMLFSCTQLRNTTRTPLSLHILYTYKYTLHAHAINNENHILELQLDLDLHAIHSTAVHEACVAVFLTVLTATLELTTRPKRKEFKEELARTIVSKPCEFSISTDQGR
jgi:hypothetical protein